MKDSAPLNVMRGDVVLVAFPYTTEDGLIQTRRRPGVVVSTEQRNAQHDDVLLAPLTSRVQNSSDQRALLLVQMSSPPGKAGGLRSDSIVDCTVIATIPKALIVTKIGRFPAETMQAIQDRIDFATGE